jgi:hypothetical protein
VARDCVVQRKPQPPTQQLSYQQQYLPVPTSLPRFKGPMQAGFKIREGVDHQVVQPEQSALHTGRVCVSVPRDPDASGAVLEGTFPVNFFRLRFPLILVYHSFNSHTFTS